MPNFNAMLNTANPAMQNGRSAATGALSAPSAMQRAQQPGAFGTPAQGLPGAQAGPTPQTLDPNGQMMPMNGGSLMGAGAFGIAPGQAGQMAPGAGATRTGMMPLGGGPLGAGGIGGGRTSGGGGRF